MVEREDAGVRLVVLLSLRNLLVRPVQVGLTALGISLGVGLFTAIDTVSESIFRSFQESIESLTGSARLTVFGSEGGIPESKLEVVEKVPGVKAAVPMIESKVYRRTTGGNATETLVVLGVDLLRESSVRAYRVGTAGVLDDPLEFLNAPNSILVTNELADRLKLVLGSELELTTAGGRRLFRVRGILPSVGPAKAYGGKLAIMDIDAAREAFGKSGKVDRIDLVLEKGATDLEVAPRVEAALGPAFRVETQSGQSATLLNLVGGYRSVLGFMSTLALLVSLFVVSNSMSIRVAERRRELGTLRCIGANRGFVMRLTSMEATVLGCMGSCFGIVLGQLFARGIAGAVSAAMGAQYLMPISVSSLNVTPRTAALGLTIGPLGSWIASQVSARRASRLSPLESVKATGDRGQLEEEGNSYALGFIGVLMTLWVPLDYYTGTSQRHEAFALLAMICAVLGSALVGPFLVLNGLRLLRRYVRAGIPFRLAVENLLRNPRRTGSNVMSLVVGLQLVTLLAAVGTSARFTASEWIEKVIPADLIVSSDGRVSSYQVQPLQPSIEEELNRIPGVDVAGGIGATAIRFVRQHYEGTEIAIKAFGRPHPRAKALFDIVDRIGAADEFYSTQEPVVMASENFVRKFKLGTGDSVVLNTPTGPARFKIIARIKEFTNPNGVLYIPMSAYRKYWNDSLVTAFFVFCRPGVRATDLAPLIDERLGRSRGVVVTQHQELRKQGLAMIDESFGYVGAIELTALLIGFLGLLNTLLISVLERRRELGILRAIGMSRGQLGRMVTSEALLLGGVGALSAVLVGSFISYFWIVGTISSLLGWIIQFRVPWLALGGTVLAGMIIGAVAVIAPLRRAVKLQIVEAIGVQ